MILANEYMADCKLKFILNTKYRNGQIAQGFTPGCYFQCKIEFDETTQKWVRNIDLRSLQACADHILAFFRAGGTYNAIDAAHSELLSNEVTSAEYEEYMSVYPPGTVLVREYAKLQGHSGAFNSKSPEVRAIRNKLKGQSSKLPIKLLSITALSLKVDRNHRGGGREHGG